MRFRAMQAKLLRPTFRSAVSTRSRRDHCGGSDEGADIPYKALFEISIQVWTNHGKHCGKGMEKKHDVPQGAARRE